MATSTVSALVAARAALLETAQKHRCDASCATCPAWRIAAEEIERLVAEVQRNAPFVHDRDGNAVVAVRIAA